MADQKLSISLETKDNASKKIQGAGNSIKNTMKKISAAAALAGAGIIAFAKSSVDAFLEDERASNRLTAIATQVTGASKEQITALQNQASALEKVGVVTDGVVMAGQSQLASFALTSEQITKLTPSFADLVVAQKGYNATQEDAIQLANGVGKAIANGSLAALEKQGLVLTQAQKDMFELANQEERVAIMADVIASNYGGLNEAFRNSAEGGLFAAKLAFDNLKETIGAAVLPTLTQLAEKMQPIIENFAKWATDNPDLVMSILKITLAVIAFIAISYPLITAIGAIGKALLFIAANPVVLVIAAIVLLIASIVLLIANWDAAKVKALEIWGKIKEYLIETMVSIGEGIQKFGASIKEAMDKGMEGVKKAWSDGWETVKSVVATIAGGIIGIIDSMMGSIGSAIGKLKELAEAARAVAGGAMAGASSGGAKSSSKSSGKSGKRASGGNVYGGQSYLVGEKGPEKFSPGQSGRIIPNNRMGGGVNISVNVSGNTVLGSNMRQFATMIGDQLMNELRMQIKLA